MNTGKLIPTHLKSIYSYSESIPTTKWEGTGMDILMTYLYLNKKHNHVLFPHTNLTQDKNDMMWKLVLKYNCSPESRKFQLTFPMEEEKYFHFILQKIKENKKIKRKSLRKRFFCNGIFIGEKSCDIHKGHYNIIVFDSYRMVLERYEPYGYQEDDSKLRKTLDTELFQVFQKYGLKIKVIPPSAFMSKNSLQSIEEFYELPKGKGTEKPSDPFGFCGVWGTFLVDQRLSYPDTDTKTLIRKVEKLLVGKKTLHDFARNLSHHYLKRAKNVLGKKSIYGFGGFSRSSYSLELVAETELDKDYLKSGHLVSPDKKLSLNLTRKLFQKNKVKPSKTKKTKKKESKQKSQLGKSKKSNLNQILKKQISFLTCQKLKNIDHADFEGEGVTNQVFSKCFPFQSSICEIKLAFRIMPYLNKYGTGKRHPVKVEHTFLKIFNKLVDTKKTPHLTYLYHSLNCNYRDLITDAYQREELEEKILDREMSPNLTVMIQEFCMGGTFKDYLDAHPKKTIVIKNILFQILYTICVLQYQLPGFRHNDLHNKNVMLQVLPPSKKSGHFEYHIGGKIFYLPSYGIQAKIIDFDTTCSDKYPNQKISLDKVYFRNGVICQNNAVFDTHLFLNSCFYSFFKKSLGKSMYNTIIGNKFNTVLSKELEDFITRNIPMKYLGFNSNKLGYARIKDPSYKVIDGELKTPLELILGDSLFQDFLTKPSQSKKLDKYHSGIPSLSELDAKTRLSMVSRT